MKIAVIANIGAGSGKAEELLKRVSSLWQGHRFLGVRGFGGELCEKCLPEPQAEGYVERITAASAALLKESPDVLLVIGGDGTAAYASEAAAGSRVPMAGIAAGTANVGPIISMGADDEIPRPEEMIRKSINALELLRADGSHLAYAYNDLVLGNTYLGTKDGKTVTFEARALAAEGRKEEAGPIRDISDGNLCFTLDGTALPPLPFAPAQLIASPLETAQYYGKAVNGLLCYTPDSPYEAAVYVSPNPVVSCEESSAGFEAWYTGAQLLLKEGSELTVSGLDPRVCAVADGNPYLIPAAGIKLRYCPDLVSVLLRR